MHGGLNGTEDTGYDDSAMNAYIKQDSEQDMLQIDEEEGFAQMLNDHRHKVLVEKMAKDEDAESD